MLSAGEIPPAYPSPRYTAGALPRPPAPACPSRRDEPVGAWLRRRTVCGNPLWGPPHTGQWPAHYSRSHAFCGRSQPIDSPPFARESGCSAPPLTLHTNSPCRCGCQVPETTPTAAWAAAASNRSSRARRALGKPPNVLSSVLSAWRSGRRAPWRVGLRQAPQRVLWVPEKVLVAGRSPRATGPRA